MGREDQIFNLGTVLSKFLMLGMPLERVIACVTSNAVKAMPAFRGLGTLAPGAVADVVVMAMEDGEFEFVDNAHEKRTGKQKLVTRATFQGGRRVSTAL